MKTRLSADPLSGFLFSILVTKTGINVFHNQNLTVIQDMRYAGTAVVARIVVDQNRPPRSCWVLAQNTSRMTFDVFTRIPDILWQAVTSTPNELVRFSVSEHWPVRFATFSER